MTSPCTEKAALLLTYSDSARQYSQAVTELHERIGRVPRKEYEKSTSDSTGVDTNEIGIVRAFQSLRIDDFFAANDPATLLRSTDTPDSPHKSIPMGRSTVSQ